MLVPVLGIPEEGETVKQHGHRGCALHSQWHSISRIFESEELFTVVMSDFNGPPAGICRQHFCRVKVEVGTVVYLSGSVALGIAAQDQRQQAIPASFVIQSGTSFDFQLGMQAILIDVDAT